MKTHSLTILSATAIGLLISANSSANLLEKTEVKFSGYIKADGMWSDYSDGKLASNSIGRDFHVPSLTPVAGNDGGAQFDAHIRQSRFRFTTESGLDNGDKIIGVFEFDFMVTPGGNERVSNSFSPRIRHAFIKYNNWLVGQTWTTFQDVTTLPETLDFVGVADGTIFARQVMLRYTSGNFEIALENPETTITPNGGGGRIDADDNSMPDLIGRYTLKQDWGHIKVAGILRQLAYDNGVNIDTDDTGYGVSITSKIYFGKDDLRIMANFGSGLGRYLALNAGNGAVLNNNNELEAIDSYGWSVAYRHMWDEQWRSSLTYSAYTADNDIALTGTAVTKQSYSTRVNLLYSPTKALTVGAEYAFAKREIENGLEGDMNRLQFSAKYAF